jgi:hypothetical protein
MQCMGPFFGFPPLKISRPLHISSPSNNSDNHTGTDEYIHLAFLQLTFFNKMLTLSDFLYTCMESARKFLLKLYAAQLPSQDVC